MSKKPIIKIDKAAMKKWVSDNSIMLSWDTSLTMEEKAMACRKQIEDFYGISVDSATDARIAELIKVAEVNGEASANFAP